MVMLTGALGFFKPFKALVFGDFMLDTYTIGSVSRISPEAPVSVLKVEKDEEKAGGAGNVALNLASLGGEVHVVGRIGDDHWGSLLKNTLESEGIVTSGLFVQKGFQTPHKNRLIADRQQIVRVDREILTPLSQELLEAICKKLDSLMEGVSIIAVSDYDKKFLHENLLRNLFAKAKEKNIPVICDPKGYDFTKYSGAYLVKPNLKEAYGAAKLSDDTSLEEVAQKLHRDAEISYLMITKSEEGISLFDKKGAQMDFPVESREVIDVTGAGDTVLATICASLACGLGIDVAVQFANISAGIAIEKLGCARITLTDLAHRLLKIDSENKVFEENHLFALERVLRKKRFSILVFNSKNGLTPKMFQMMHNFSKREKQKLIAYIRDPEPDMGFVHLLSSLNEVDFIVLKKESIKNLCQAIHPDKILFMDEKKSKEAEAFLALL